MLKRIAENWQEPKDQGAHRVRSCKYEYVFLPVVRQIHAKSCKYSSGINLEEGRRMGLLFEFASMEQNLAGTHCRELENP